MRLQMTELEYRERLNYSLKAHKESVNFVSICRDLNYLASCSVDKTNKLWDLTTGKHVRTYIGHDFSINSVQFSSEAKELISSSNDGSIMIWPLKPIKNK